MFRIQVQDDDEDTTVWHNVNGPDGKPLLFENAQAARAKLTELYPVYVQMERYTGPKRTRVIEVWKDED